ncbi:MAG: hypothetical protein KGJ02_07895 [Verrucomicrobiota bacterium]|nr:hypothetical protein [Verrucomicrobiota bacterium]
MTTPPDKIPDNISPKGGIESEKPLSQPPSTFESYMQESATPGRSAPAVPANATQLPTSPAPINPHPTYDTISVQARTIQDSLGTVENQLNTPNLKLKRSQTHLLKNKLQDANGYIRQAGAKLGVEAQPLKMPPGANPIGRFLAYIGDGQDKLLSVQQKLKELAAEGNEMRPGDMMLVQVKMGQAQQEVEYSSNLLNQVIYAIKTILNTQL